MFRLCVLKLPGGSGPRRGIVAAGLVLVVAGCRNEMYNQPKVKPLSASAFFTDGASARPLVPGTVARGDLRADELLYTGKIDGKDADVFPFAIDAEALKRGQERYTIFCAPCHGARGDGQGMIVQRGFPSPPSYYEQLPKTGPTRVAIYDDLRQAPVGHFFDVITHGHGVMYSYAARVSVEDRWKIAAYIRALQLSRRTTVDDLKAIDDPTPEERQLLQEAHR